jgi:hypothetical protein
MLDEIHQHYADRLTLATLARTPVADLRCMAVATLLDTDQPIDGVGLLQILVLPSAQFHANGPARENSRPGQRARYQPRGTIRKRDEFASMVHD